MKILLQSALLILCSVSAGTAQETSSTDLSRYELLEEGETTKTLSELQELEDSYKKLVASGNCDAAIPVIIEFYEAANILSNLIRRGNEPYYDASRDDKDNIAKNRALLNELIAAENTFNNLIRQRNRAWVEEAKCLLVNGEKQEATTRLYRALDYISGDERDLWEEARTLLWAEVGFTAKN